MIEWMVTSSLLIVTVLLLRRVLRGRISMGLQYALWGLVLLRLLIPGTVASSRVSVMNVLPQEPAALLSEPVEDQSFMPEDQGAADPAGGNLQPSVSQNAGDQSAGVVQAPQSGAAGQTASNRPDNDSGRAWTIGKILRAVWLTGVGGMGLWMLMGNLRFARRLRRMRVPAEGKRHVYVAAALPSPCLYGLFPPAIYLTPQAAEDEAMCRYVLRHEETHRRHGDHIWAVLRGVALALHWYNPLVWAAAILSRRDGELACDEAVLRGSGDRERAEYGRVLIRLVTERPRPGELLCCATTMSAGASALKERIAMIARKPRTLWAALLAAVLVLTVAAGCTFTGANPGEEPDSGWTLDESQVTDDALISLVIGEEVALTGDNSFTFQTPMDLSSQELYMLALLWGGDTGKFDHCYDPEKQQFTIRQEDVEEVLALHLKKFAFDITEVSGYDSAAGGVVTWTVTGFGGDRYMSVAEKTIDGNVVTFTANFYENADLTGQPYEAKTYTIEFFDGGCWFLSAVLSEGESSTPENRSLSSLIESGGGVSGELIRAAYAYQLQTDLHHQYEWRTLPDFGPDEAVDWDQLTLFVFFMCDELGRNEAGYVTISAEVFDEVVHRYLPDLSYPYESSALDYTHQSSSFFTFADGVYTATGWDFGGSVRYRPASVEARGDGTYTMVLDGFNFYEMDFLPEESDHSDTMEALISYAGGWPEDVDSTLLEIFQREDYDQILPVFERVELTFRLSGEENAPFQYLSCKRERTTA